MTKEFSTTNLAKVKDYSLKTDVNEYLEEILGEKFLEYRKKWNYATKMEKLYDFPLFLVFEPMWKCNLACIMCLHSNQSNPRLEYKEKMPWKMYKKIMDEVKLHGCPSITIGGHCEPLLDKRLSDMVAVARNSGVIDIMINTNATLLKRKIGEKLIMAGLTRLRVGFDGATRQTYESVRIGAEFEKVKQNIIDFLSLRSEIRSKLPIVRISCVHLLVNDYEIDNFVDFWISKADYVSIQRYRPHELTEDRARKKIGAGVKKIENIKCSEPWERLYIRGNGDVYPCCQPAIGPLVGNINRNSIYEIWNSEAMRFLRNVIINGDWDSIPACKNCMIQNYNL